MMLFDQADMLLLTEWVSKPAIGDIDLFRGDIDYTKLDGLIVGEVVQRLLRNIEVTIACSVDCRDFFFPSSKQLIV